MSSSLERRYQEKIVNFDRERAVRHICNRMKQIMREQLHRRGLVVAVSGGIDSSVSAALAVKAFGTKRVLALLLPEVDSSPDTQPRGELLVEHLGIEYINQNIAPTLEAIGCYKWRDDAIRTLFPLYDGRWKNKIVISGGLSGQINRFELVVQDPDGNVFKKRMKLREYLQIVAATSYKQRIRKTIEYFHADRLNYAVVGTPNRLEYDQGFFVKNGDGSADLKPIAHLYKTQVYALADYLGLPEEICNAIPTTDTYSLEQGQDEFYFALPYAKMDKALWARNNGASSEELARVLEITTEQAINIFKDIDNKRTTTSYLHLKPCLIDPVPELDHSPV